MNNSGFRSNIRILRKQNGSENPVNKPYLQHFHALFALKTSLFWSVKKPSFDDKQAFFARKQCFRHTKTDFCRKIFSILQVRVVKIFYHESGAIIRYLHFGKSSGV